MDDSTLVYDHTPYLYFPDHHSQLSILPASRLTSLSLPSESNPERGFDHASGPGISLRKEGGFRFNSIQSHVSRRKVPSEFRLYRQRKGNSS